MAHEIIYERDIKKILSKQLAEYVNESEFKPWYIAYYSEISETAFRNYLKGSNLPKPITLIMIAEVLRCSVNDLLGYEHRDYAEKDKIFDSWRDSPKVTEYFWSRVNSYSRAKNIYNLEVLAFEAFLGTFTLRYDFNNNILPDLRAILAICSALECTPSDLLGY